MKQCFYCFSLLVFLSGGRSPALAQSTRWGPETNGLQISLTLAKEMHQVATNQPFIVSIRIRNVSTNETFIVPFGNLIDENEYSFTIAFPSGKEISTRPRLVPRSQGDTGLAPNQTVAFEFNLRRLCAFEELGKYTIAVRTRVSTPHRESAFSVFSNTIEVRVVPSPEPDREKSNN